MPKKSAAIRAVTDPVLPMNEIAKMSQKEACERFAERATVSQRAFAEMGKLHNAISASLKKGQTIYGELRKLGVKDSTISNASYASKVVDLVKAGHISEAQYDSFTFADCLATCRVMGDKSARKLTGEEVKAVIAAAPDTFDAEFESIYATGLTVAEEIAQAKAKADAEAKAEADRKAAEAAEVKRQAEEKAKADLEAQRAADEAGKAPATPPPTASESPAPVSETAPTASIPTPAGPSAESAPTPEPVAPTGTASDVSAQSAAPSNVQQMPDDPDVNLSAVLDDLDNILSEVGEMTVEAKKAVFDKLNAMMAHLDSQINAPVSAAA